MATRRKNEIPWGRGVSRDIELDRQAEQEMQEDTGATPPRPKRRGKKRKKEYTKSQREFMERDRRNKLVNKINDLERMVKNNPDKNLKWEKWELSQTKLSLKFLDEKLAGIK